LIRELLETSLPGFARDLRAERDFLQTLPSAMFSSETPAASSSAKPFASHLIAEGERKYRGIPVPILAIFAVPHDMGQAMANDPVLRAAFDAEDEASTGAQALAFEKGVPSARVVRLAHASHFVFRSNEADVLRELSKFVGGLP
jgi:hypothetical protein